MEVSNLSKQKRIYVVYTTYSLVYNISVKSVTLTHIIFILFVMYLSRVYICETGSGGQRVFVHLF